ncbi:MAG: hypothetical protein N2234_08455, partial [Planctomycetota bacterium]|nr:hypothetical protein [Planctomycetota bacterium]
ESLEEIGRLLAGGREWVLQQFNPKKCLEPEYEKIVPYELFFLKKIASNLSRYLPVRVRGEYD